MYHEVAIHQLIPILDLSIFQLSLILVLRLQIMKIACSKPTFYIHISTKSSYFISDQHSRNANITLILSRIPLI